MHIPVLVNEAVKLLRVETGGTFFDGTVGLGGHSAAILKASPDNHLYGTDRDQESLQLAKENLEPFTGRFTLFCADFRSLESLPLEIETIDGFLFDLGVSSFQLDNPARGFAYALPAPLDMRMDKAQQVSAADVVNHYSHRELCDVLRKYGEFKNPARIAEQIIFHRKEKNIENTGELKEIIRRLFPRQKSMDPLARVFQAIRIEVNQELTGLEDLFLRLFVRMKPGARAVVISFHSLEDRVAKAALKRAKESKIIDILTKKPIRATKEEIHTNVRARSAKLRAGEKI